MTTARQAETSETYANGSALGLFHELEELYRGQRLAWTTVAQKLDWPRAGLGVLMLIANQVTASLSEIADHLRVDMSVASRQVSQLVDAGHVRRTPSTEDGRVKLLELTDSGRTLHAEVVTASEEIINTMFADWSTDQLSSATDQIRQITAAITATPTAADDN